MAILTSLKLSAVHKALIYGAPKTGKTELAGALSSQFNLLWFDCEQGWSTLTKLPAEQQSRINVISIPDSRIYPIAAETWLKVIKGTPATICQKHGKVSCMICSKAGDPTDTVELNALPNDTIVVFDSLTQLTNSFISHLTKDKPDDYKLQLDDWGNLRVLIDKFLSQVQSAPYNVICITHEEEAEMEDGKKKIVPVAGSSKSSRNTAKYFDTVVYCEVKNRKHTFGSKTTFSSQAIAGSRVNVALEDKAEPTLLDIFTLHSAPPSIASPTVAPSSPVHKSQGQLQLERLRGKVNGNIS
jgi:AAA domain